MNVYAEGLNPADKPLHLLDKLGIALDRRHCRVTPVTHWVSAGACEHNTVRRCRALEFGDHFGEVVLRLRYRAAHAGNDFDGGLHQLVP